MPVYLWWSRVGAAEGLSLVGERPGTPALIPTHRERARDRVGARRRRGAVRVDAGERAGRGRAGARPRRDTPARVARRGGPGRRMDHLPGRRLPREPRARRRFPRRRRRPSPAARAAEPSPRRLLLGGGGLAHPEFFLVAVAVLVATAAWSWWDGRAAPSGHPSAARADAGRVLAALGGGAAIVLGGSSRVWSAPLGSRGTPRSTRCSDGRGNGRSSAACTLIASSGTGGDTPRS